MNIVSIRIKIIISFFTILKSYRRLARIEDVWLLRTMGEKPDFQVVEERKKQRDKGVRSKF